MYKHWGRSKMTSRKCGHFLTPYPPPPPPPLRRDVIFERPHFHIYDKDTIRTSFQPRNRASRSHDYQPHLLMPKDGTRGLQTNSFYFRTAKMWNNLPKHVVNAKNINTITNMLDKHWEDSSMKYDHRPPSDT